MAAAAAVNTTNNNLLIRPQPSPTTRRRGIYFPSPVVKLSSTNLYLSSKLKTTQLSMALAPISKTQQQELPALSSSPLDLEQTHNKPNFPILVNGCTGKMGQSVIKVAVSAGLQLIPISFSNKEQHGNIVQVGGVDIHIYGPSEREEVLVSVFDAHPDVIVVDYTVPAAVNGNAELYCKVGVPFVMGTTGGDRERLHKTVEDAHVYALISQQMAKQVVVFLADLKLKAEKYPNALAGYSLQVIESHQASKLDMSGTAKVAISLFQKLGAYLDQSQLQQIRDPIQQVQMMGVPEEYLDSHAFHTYRLTSPDKTFSSVFQHNICGRSAYAEGAIDAAVFLAKKVRSEADKRIYDMIDVLTEGGMA